MAAQAWSREYAEAREEVVQAMIRHEANIIACESAPSYSAELPKLRQAEYDSRVHMWRAIDAMADAKCVDAVRKARP